MLLIPGSRLPLSITIFTVRRTGALESKLLESFEAMRSPKAPWAGLALWSRGRGRKSDLNLQVLHQLVKVIVGCSSSLRSIESRPQSQLTRHVASGISGET